MTSRQLIVSAALVAPLALILPQACTTSGSSSFGNDDDGSGANGSGNGSGGAGGLDFTVGSGGGGGDAPCLAEEAQAEPITLDMVLVVDRSGSMVIQGNWAPTVNALKAFFDDPLSDGINVGLNLFPRPPTDDNCDPNAYNPPWVPGGGMLNAIPAQAGPLKTALDNNPSVSGQQTPMYGALDGSYQFALQQQMNEPGHKVIVTLAGDGIPSVNSDCRTVYGNTTVETIGECANLASQYFNDHGIETYAISITSNVKPEMDQVAAAGGTTEAIDVSSDITALSQTMLQIRDAALGCEYLIPDDTEEEFDPLKVNVNLTPGGGTTETIPQADNLADCGNAEGWYYDDPVNPTKIILCPATCDRVQMDAMANIRIAFGCPTEIN